MLEVREEGNTREKPKSFYRKEKMSDRTPGGSGSTFRENRSPEALVYLKHG
jgi:hypothetical protein